MPLGEANVAVKSDRQNPGLLILTGHHLAQRWRGDEVLQHHDVALVLPQRVDQCPIGGFVGRAESFVVAQSTTTTTFSDPDCLNASAISLAATFAGASAGRIATGWRSDISLSVGMDSGSAIASATQKDDHDIRPPHDEIA